LALSIQRNTASGYSVHEPEQISLTPIWRRRRAFLRTSTKEYRYREWRSGCETLVVAPYFATKTLKRWWLPISLYHGACFVALRQIVQKLARASVSQYRATRCGKILWLTYWWAERALQSARAGV